MKRFVLDTNHLSEAVCRISVVRDRIQQLHKQGNVFGTGGPALGVIRPTSIKYMPRPQDLVENRPETTVIRFLTPSFFTSFSY